MDITSHLKFNILCVDDCTVGITMIFFPTPSTSSEIRNVFSFLYADKFKMAAGTTHASPGHPSLTPTDRTSTLFIHVVSVGRVRCLATKLWTWHMQQRLTSLSTHFHQNNVGVLHSRDVGTAGYSGSTGHNLTTVTRLTLRNCFPSCFSFFLLLLTQTSSFH